MELDMKECFDITGMSCAACQVRVEKSVSRLEGVKDVNVNLLKNSMEVEYDENAVSESGIVDAVSMRDTVLSRGRRENLLRMQPRLSPAAI